MQTSPVRDVAPEHVHPLQIAECVHHDLLLVESYRQESDLIVTDGENDAWPRFVQSVASTP